MEIELSIPGGTRVPRLSADSLTPRQLEVLALLCHGLSNKRIGERLTIANGTVKVHVAGILRALNACSRLEAVSVARGLGLDRAKPSASTQLAGGVRQGARRT